jgi:ubiquinone/menaquinone biosynthesis C-methylase UbiE
MLKYLNKDKGKRGVDVGCGLGWYAEFLSKFVNRVVGVDNSKKIISLARRASKNRNTFFLSADSAYLPFKSNSFDFAYTINMLHHIEVRDRKNAIREMIRIVKPSGYIFIFEMNTKNPLFSFYINYIFPRLKKIDTGEETYLREEYILDAIKNKAKLEKIEYFSFIPDFIPKILLPFFKIIESLIEKTPLTKLGVHYVVIARKDGGQN